MKSRTAAKTQNTYPASLVPIKAKIMKDLTYGRSWDTKCRRIRCSERYRDNHSCMTIFVTDGFFLGSGLRQIYENFFAPYDEDGDYDSFVSNFTDLLPDQLTYIDCFSELQVSLADLYSYQCGEWSFDKEDYLNILYELARIYGLE